VWRQVGVSRPAALESRIPIRWYAETRGALWITDTRLAQCAGDALPVALMNFHRQGFFEGARARDLVIGWGIIGVPIATLIVLGAVFLKPEPIPREQVFGCYIAMGAPSLRIRSDAIYIGDDRQGSFTYIAEPYKAGYHLTVSPALGLHPTKDGRYVFFPDRGIGYLWELLPKGTASRMRVPDDYSGRFEVIAANGTSVVYSRNGAAARCGA
jgi:hypothetical protein